MKIIEKNLETHIIEKKSKFISNIIYVNSIHEAEEKLKQIKKKYYDAKHNCYAYRIMEGENILERSSDDGEPSGTAGMPILDILRGEKIGNVLVVVTRYFGGVLLGTGGLVRSYSEATNKAILENNLLEMEMGYEMEITLDYKNFEIFKYYCEKTGISIIGKEYGENIKIIAEVDENSKQEICENSEKSRFKVIESRIMSKKLIRKNR